MVTYNSAAVKFNATTKGIEFSCLALKVPQPWVESLVRPMEEALRTDAS